MPHCLKSLYRAQINVSKDSPCYSGFTEVGSRKIGTEEVSLTEVCSTEDGIPEDSIPQIGTIEGIVLLLVFIFWIGYIIDCIYPFFIIADLLSLKTKSPFLFYNNV